MKFLRRTVLFPIFIALVAMSCAAPQTIPPLLCPAPPVPFCKPGTFDKTTIDTTAELHHVQTHIIMLPAPANSNAQDYAIGFIPTSSGTIALITSDRSSESDSGSYGEQRIFSARFLGTTRYGPLQPIQMENVPLPMGTACYCKADQLLYFSAKAKNTDPDDYDLYTAKVEIQDDNITLSDVESLDRINTVGHFDSQPAIDPTGTHLYFVSDRAGGDGGTDIWYSERSSARSGEWSAPQPLPEPVNSPCDEISPFIPSFDPTTLYFASNGHETVGGYDLFKIHIHNGEYSEPENLGKPMNTTADEVFPSALNDTAFFWASNAATSMGGMNLYTITRTHIGPPTPQEQLPPPERIHPEPLREDSIAEAKLGPIEIIAHVTRGADNHPAAGADIYVREDSQDIYRGTIPLTGEIGFKVKRDREYDVGAETADAFFDVRHLDLRGARDSVVHVYLHLPDTLVIRINFPFDDYEHPYEYTIDENGQPSTMTWQRALDLTAHSALASLDKLRELLLIGHTDSLGTDAYNNRLGMQRATFIASELEKRGVPSNIVRIESAGRTEPVLRRPDESDEVFRLRSRRVDFVKIFR
ncbi:MAG TPA: OmpA family protein [Candidatus Kapabacteria bacterium]